MITIPRRSVLSALRKSPRIAHALLLLVVAAILFAPVSLWAGVFGDQVGDASIPVSHSSAHDDCEQLKNDASTDLTDVCKMTCCQDTQSGQQCNHCPDVHLSPFMAISKMLKNQATNPNRFFPVKSISFLTRDSLSLYRPPTQP